MTDMDAKHPESEAPEPRSGRIPSTEPAGPPDGCEDQPESRETVPPGPSFTEGQGNLALLASVEESLDRRFTDIRGAFLQELADFEERSAARVQALTRHLQPVLERAMRDADTDRRMAAIEADLASLRAHCERCPSFLPSRAPEPEDPD